MSAPALPSLLVGEWQPSAVPVLAAGAAAVAYLAAAVRVRGGWPHHRTLAFVGGLGTVVVALCSGVERFDDRLLTAHMVQHLLLMLIAPALLRLGRPLELALRASAPAARPPLARAARRAGTIARPLPILVGFAAVVLLTHVPACYDATLAHPALHDVEHALYLTAGLALWYPVLDADPAPHRRLGGLGRLLYVIVAMVPMAALGAYLNRHPTLVYATYGPPARALGISAVSDQQHAGAIMWVLGDLVMVIVGLWAAMQAMVAEERRQQARERRGVRSEGMAR